MFWIMGGEGLICLVAALLGYPDFKQRFGHVTWTGLQFMDMVFPTFLFLAGLSFPLSSLKSAERGMPRRAIAARAIRRGISLVVLGWVYQGFLSRLNFDSFRIPSVLGYIGFGWTFAALIYLYVRDVRMRIALVVVILTATTLTFGLVPAPDADTYVFASDWARNTYAEFGRGPFSPVGNLGCWLDRNVLGRHALYPGLFDKLGFAGLIPTIATAMLGVFAGEIVLRDGLEATWVKTRALLVSGAVCLSAGLALSLCCPIVKNLWSPSFVLVVGGYSFALFALFYWLIDVRKHVRWSFFFRVIGVNSITIYIVQKFVDFDKIANFFLGGAASWLPNAAGRILLSIGYVFFCWLLLLFLYRKNVFLKV